MRYNILQKIKEKTHLAEVFNAYMKGLSMLEQMSLPHESMSQYRAATGTDAFVKISKWERLYELVVLSNALTDTHKNAVWAYEKLKAFFAADAEHGQDLKAYAIQNRLRSIDEWGSEDESDWVEDGLDEQGEQKWKPAYKDDPESLHTYTLYEDMRQFFRDGESMGERLGTSDPDDYAFFSRLVEKQSEMSPFKFLSEKMGIDLPVYHQNEAGEMVQEGLADRVEREINEDINNQNLVSIFEDRIVDCVELAYFFEHMNPESVEDFRTMYHDLHMLLWFWKGTPEAEAIPEG